MWQLAFATPWALAALVALPAIWWLIRFTPPRPRTVAFAPLRLLETLRRDEEKPQTSPWWLTALRLLLAALVIFALSGPSWDPRPGIETSARGTLVVIVDDSWAAARGFAQKRAAVDARLEAADRNNQPVVLLSASAGTDQGFSPGRASDARDRLRSLAPVAWIPDRGDIAIPLTRMLRATPDVTVAWYGDGLLNGNARELAAAILSVVPPDRVLIHRDQSLSPLVIGTPTNGAEALGVSVQRADLLAPASGILRASDVRGRTIGTQSFEFGPNQRDLPIRFELPLELRNDVFRLEIADGGTVGGVQLLDDRFRRRTVGLFAGGNESEQPLLSPLFFLGEALAPFADVRQSTGTGTLQALRDLIEQRVSVIVLADVGAVPGEVQPQLERWLRGGGVLIRFAGTRLATQQRSDPFVPVTLRPGARTLGGNLTWEQPQRIGRFAPTGPFAGLTSPADVLINRQILAEPEPTLPQKTWAELADGTPLVTAEARGEGWVVLVHVTADPDWSNLPLSFTFLEMIRRTVALSASTGATQDDRIQRASGPEPQLPPLRLLDATGASQPSDGLAKPIATRLIATTTPSRDHPPGLYGRDDAFRALNALKPGDTIEPWPADLFPPGVSYSSFGQREVIAMKPWLLAAAALLLLIDSLIVLLLGGSGRMRRRAAAATAAALGIFLLLPAPEAYAQAREEAQLQLRQGPLRGQPSQPAPRQQVRPPANPLDAFALNATSATRLAYVLTGVAEVDAISKAGLEGLTRVLLERTALEPAEPVGVDLARDELAFFPMLYWPIDRRAQRPSAEVMGRADAFMKNGGTILFDTRDQSDARPLPRGGFDTPGLARLREMLQGIDVPELEAVPADHVMTKAFYLLTAFPGRFEDGVLWTEKTPENPEGMDRPVRVADGVSPILITTSDFAGAWAVDARSQPLLPTFGGNARQREMSYRVGVNIVMYLLTGNYKADQVHVQDILQRLGQ